MHVWGKWGMLKKALETSIFSLLSSFIHCSGYNVAANISKMISYRCFILIPGTYEYDEISITPGIILCYMAQLTLRQEEYQGSTVII